MCPADSWPSCHFLLLRPHLPPNLICDAVALPVDPIEKQDLIGEPRWPVHPCHGPPIVSSNISRIVMQHAGVEATGQLQTTSPTRSRNFVKVMVNRDDEQDRESLVRMTNVLCQRDVNLVYYG